MPSGSLPEGDAGGGNSYLGVMWVVKMIPEGDVGGGRQRRGETGKKMKSTLA